MKETSIEQQHLAQVLDATSHNVILFLTQFDPSASEASMQYAREVLGALDNLAIALTNQKGSVSEKMAERMKARNEEVIQAIIDRHNENKPIH